MIHDSPSAIYHHALPFVPSSSWLRKCYSPMLSQEVSVVKGLQTGWGMCSRTVSFDNAPWALAYWRNSIAVGCSSGDIMILDGISGIHTSVLSNHTDGVNSLSFSSDGTFLVSGSKDKTTNLWDIQTGGVVKTLHGHTKPVFSVSISPDCTIVASGSWDNTIWLWNIQTGECHYVIGGHSDIIHSVSFSPTNSKVLWSASKDGTIQKWDVNGHQIGSAFEGNFIAFSLDGTNFISWKWGGRAATVRNSDSGEVVVELQSPRDGLQYCCFSPDSKFIAGGGGGSGHAIYIWDITSSNPYIMETFVGHTKNLTSLIFSSLLISSSEDKSVKFWQTDASLRDPALANSNSMLFPLASIKSVSLQATGDIAISSDSAGVVKTWDISTGLCKESFQTPAQDPIWRDAQLIGGRLILIWFEDGDIYIWETKSEELLIVKVKIPDIVVDLRISGDGSKVFILGHNSIKAWSIGTGEVVGEVKLKGKPLHGSLVVDGSRIWVYFEDSHTQGWDFGVPGSTPLLLSTMFPDRPHLYFIGTELQDVGSSRIEDTITGKEILQLSGRYVKPRVARWDGQYLVAGYESGEVLILNFTHMVPL